MSSTTEGSPVGLDSTCCFPTTPLDLYKPLLPNETRLLGLLPGSYDNPLHCELHQASTLSGLGLLVSGHPNAVQYTALSRSASDQVCSQAPILCNGSILGVSKSIASVLRALRYADRPRWVWIDSICINQADLDERSEHIKSTFCIFSRAERVVAWLGESNEYVQSVLRDIRAIHFDHTVRDTSQSCLADLSARKRVIVYMQQQQWFYNVWSRAEVRAATYLELRVGGVSVDFDKFALLACQLRLATPQLKSLAPHCCIGVGRRTPKLAGKSLVSKVFSLLSDSWLFHAPDDRDSVFSPLGVLGIIPDYTAGQDRSSNVKHAFEATYAQNTSSVFQNLIKYLIILTRSLECLEVLGPRSLDGNMPSWCIDWTKQPYYSTWASYAVPRQYMRGLDDSYPPVLQMNWIAQATAEAWMDLPNMHVEDELSVFGRRIGTLDRSTTFSTRHGAWRFYDEYCDFSPTLILPPRPDSAFRDCLSDLLTDGYMKPAFVGDWENQICNVTGLTSANDYLCGVVVDQGAQDGDVVVQFVGSRMVHVVRPAKEPGKYLLVCAGFFWHTADPSQAAWIESSSSTFSPQPEVVLWDDINNFARNLLWKGSSLHCTDFRDRVLQVAGIQYEPGVRCMRNPNSGEWKRVVRTEVPQPEVFVLV